MSISTNAARVCDLNTDKVVDATDVSLVTAATLEGDVWMGDPRDVTGNGNVTVLEITTVELQEGQYP